MKKILCALVTVVLAVNFFACGLGPSTGPVGDDMYTRYPTDYDPNIDSWEQIDPAAEDVEIVWFMDYNWSDANISQLIYKRTGVKVTFRSALSSDHSELNTMIAGGKLPDIISIQDEALRVQLAEEGYVYALNRLAESYAPSMLNRVAAEHWDYYKATDGHSYSLASHFYNQSDIAELEELGAKQYTNSSLVVRKDWLEAYIAYRTGQDASFNPDQEITKPSGFIEMCKWVKQTYEIPNSVPTVALSPFNSVGRNDKISESLTALLDFFGVKRENADGTLNYQYGDEEFVDILQFLNTLYRERLVISSNFSYNTSDLSTLFINGKTFAYIGADQEIRSSFSKREYDGLNKSENGSIPDEYQYVSIMLTDEEGNAPIMGDYTARGMNHIMITTNCRNEDRVIKVLDYLMSEQCMREMTYGEVEGEYYNFKIEPGEVNPDTGKVSTYGIIEPTKKMLDAIADSHRSNPTALGLGRMSPLYNPIYSRLTAGYDNYAGITASWYWPVYKFKKTYFENTYHSYYFRFPLDVSDRKVLNRYLDSMADIEKVWIDALPTFIMAKDSGEVKRLYRAALDKSYTFGVEDYMAYRNKCFLAYKEYLGLEYALPSNRDDYVAPTVKLYGSADKYMTCPSWVYQKS